MLAYLRHLRDWGFRNLGYVLMPYVLAKDRFEEGQWLGRRAFIIGGGESLKRFDFSPLRDELVVAVNRSHICKVADVVFTGDLRWLANGAPKENLPEDVPLVWCRQRLAKKPIPTCPLAREVLLMHCCPKSVRWGFSFDMGLVPGDSGLRAVNFAAVLGADPIYLLGFDMRQRHQRDRWWHGGYTWRRNGSYIKFRRTWKETFDSGLVHSKVINLTPDSALDFIPYENARSVLKGAS